MKIKFRINIIKNVVHLVQLKWIYYHIPHPGQYLKFICHHLKRCLCGPEHFRPSYFHISGSWLPEAKLPLSCLQLGLLMTSRNIEYFSNIQHLKNILSLKFRVMLLNSKNICQYVIFQSGQDTVVPFTPIRWSYFQNLSLPFYCEWEANCLNVQNERN